jgi:tungstate transport system substrate-binding protein
VRHRASLVLVLLFFTCQHRERTVAIATTTSVDGSGLLQVLQVAFKAKTGILLTAFVVGSGRALKMAADGTVDLTITHDPDAERAFVAKYQPEMYRQFMWNDFVVVGPTSDPADVRQATSAADAFRRMFSSRRKFLSRNDQSGTHMKELSLWRAARVRPQANPEYMPMGQPMTHLLRSADELDAYALSDRATFDQLEPSLHVVVLFAGDPVLRNVYAVTLTRRPYSEEHRNAETFTKWLLSADGRRVVESFRIRGRQEYHWLN